MKRPLPLLLAAVLVAGCGSDGGSDESAPLPRDTAVFQSSEIGFTFRYPKAFAVRKRPQDGVLGQVSVRRGARLNAIKVRKTADQELTPDRYLDEFRRDFARTVGEVEKRKEEIGGLETGVLEFEDTLRRRGERVEFTSVSYFFRGAGRTWQLECIADAEHRDRIDDACRTALESIELEEA